MKNLKNLVATIVMLFCCIAVSGQTFEVDGLKYSVTSTTDLTVSVGKVSSDLAGDIVIPAVVIYNEKEYRVTIGSSAFYGCSSLTSITISEGVTSIGSYAFSGCSNLTSITLPGSMVSIGSFAFSGCSCLTSITIPASVTSIESGTFNDCFALKNLIFEDGSETLSLGWHYISPHTSVRNGLFYACPLETLYVGRDLSYTSTSSYGYSPFYSKKSLANVIIGDNVTSIGDNAFRNCTSLTSITIPEGVTSIGNYAFDGCSLTSITLPASVDAIGSYALNGINEVVLKPTTPPTLTSSTLVSSNAVITVPKEAYSDYSTASYWSSLLTNITIDDADIRTKNLILKAADDKSTLHSALGDENLKFVTNLTISGTINSYDFMVLRTKMPLLRYLDLTETKILSNDFEHYNGYHSEEDIMPNYAFYQSKLTKVKFPKGIKAIGSSAFESCEYISELELPEGLHTIGTYAFAAMYGLKNILFPSTLECIERSAFMSRNSAKNIPLKSLDLSHTNLKTIGTEAFKSCDLVEVKFPATTLESIGNYAFQNCALNEVRIPSSVRSIGSSAFQCSNLQRVYVYTIEPINISERTFAQSGTNFVGTLYAPKVSYYSYWYATPWNQFIEIMEFDEPYENFYLVGDKELDSTTGAIVGEGDKNPDAEMGNNSGLIVEDDIVQDLGNVDIEHNGTDGGSIVVSGPDGCVNTGELHFHINVKAGKWYFFCFPFDVKREDIQMRGGADWVFRYYDGEERANNGKGGWKNVTSDGNGNFLKAATGYIFQCSREDVLVLTAKNQKIKHEDKYNELVAHVTENMHDASWNFVGNPYLSYYEVTSEDYSAPITVWDGSKYIAIRPGDDDYQLAPFEGFFVQKPEDTYAVTYSADRQMTYNQAQESAAKARARRRAMPINPDRLLVNITLSNGTDTDQTRVVFNNSATMGYETTCDAAKFETAGVPQLYTIDSRAVKYAINERPVAEGIVTMGYTAPAQGNYTLAASRMDTPICIKDNLTGTIHDFSGGSYTFMTEAGTFEDRFTIMMKADETGIENSEFRNQNSEIYDAAGRRVEKMEQGVYIKDNRKVVAL